MTSTLRHRALALLLLPDADQKAAQTRLLDPRADVGAELSLAEPPGIPGRPAKPLLVPHTQLKQRSMRTTEGRAALIHALTHIELNAIEIAVNECLPCPG